MACLAWSACAWAALLAAALAAAAAVALSRLYTRPCRYPSAPRGPGDPQHRVLLLDFFPVAGPISISPFVAKVEAFLRFAGLDYEKKYASLEDLRAAPKGKLPYILHGGTRVPDSRFIMSYLAATFGPQVAAAVAPEEARSRAVALAAQEMVETHLYSGLLFYKYGLNWAQTAAEVAPLVQDWYRVPRWAVRPFLWGLRASLFGQTVAQGVGRHSEEDVARLMLEDLSALSTLLADRPFLFGARPYSVDASLFGLLDCALHHEGAAPQLGEMVRQHPNLVGRIRSAYFSAGYRPTLVPGAAAPLGEGGQQVERVGEEKRQLAGGGPAEPVTPEKKKEA